jgi:four helix bundle protein
MNYIPVSDLEVYQLAEQLSDLIWNDYDLWDYKAQRTIGLQVIRSVDSIAANIAEGYGRFSGPDRKRFYLISRGSFEETKCWLRKAIRRKIITEDKAQQLGEIINVLGPKLNVFIKNQNIN